MKVAIGRENQFPDGSIELWVQVQFSWRFMIGRPRWRCRRTDLQWPGTRAIAWSGRPTVSAGAPGTGKPPSRKCPRALPPDSAGDRTTPIFRHPSVTTNSGTPGGPERAPGSMRAGANIIVKVMERVTLSDFSSFYLMNMMLRIFLILIKIGYVSIFFILHFFNYQKLKIL